MNLGAFGVVTFLGRRGEEFAAVSDYAGLARRRPWLAAMMALFMLSLAGVPPTVGFVGKFYLFGAAIDAGHAWLAIVGLLTSVVSAYYYLRVVYVMYMQGPSAGRRAPSRYSSPRSTRRWQPRPSWCPQQRYSSWASCRASSWTCPAPPLGALILYGALRNRAPGSASRCQRRRHAGGAIGGHTLLQSTLPVMASGFRRSGSRRGRTAGAGVW